MPRSRACTIAASTSWVPKSRPSSANSRRIAAPPRASPSPTAPMRWSSRLRALGVGAGRRSRDRGERRRLRVRRRSVPSAPLPLYVDIDDGDAADGSRVARRSGSRARTRAVVVTHLYGRLADVDAIASIATRARHRADRGLRAGARRAPRRPKMAGTFGAHRLLQLLSDQEPGRAGRRGRARHRRRDAGARRLARCARTAGAASTGSRDRRRHELADGRAAGGGAARQAAASRRAGTRAGATIAAAIRASRSRIPPIALPPPIAERERRGASVRRAHATARESLRAHLAAAGVATDIHYPVPDHRQPAWAGAIAAQALDARRSAPAPKC